MNWTSQEDKPSALSAITGDTTPYKVYILHLTMDDDIVAGCVEFWRRMLMEAPRYWTDQWEILLLEFWTDAGVLTGVFTTRDRSFDEQIVYKLLSDRILNEYEQLVNSYLGSQMFGHKHIELQNRYWTIVKKAATESSIGNVTAI